MKSILLVLVTFFAAANVQASELSCEEQVLSQISATLEEGYRVVSLDPEIVFEKHTVYSVEVGLDFDIKNPGPGTPFHITYKALVIKDSALGGCALSEVVEKPGSKIE